MIHLRKVALLKSFAWHICCLFCFVKQMELIEPLAREHLKTETECSLFLDLARTKKSAWLDRLSIVEATIARIEDKDSAERKDQADLLFAVLDTDQVRNNLALRYARNPRVHLQSFLGFVWPCIF